MYLIRAHRSELKVCIFLGKCFIVVHITVMLCIDFKFTESKQKLFKSNKNKQQSDFQEWFISKMQSKFFENQLQTDIHSTHKSHNKGRLSSIFVFLTPCKHLFETTVTCDIIVCSNHASRYLCLGTVSLSSNFSLLPVHCTQAQFVHYMISFSLDQIIPHDLQRKQLSQISCLQAVLACNSSPDNCGKGNMKYSQN